MSRFWFVKHQVIKMLTLTSVLITAFIVGSFFHPQKVSADMCGTFNCQYGVNVWYDTVAKVRKCQCKSKPAEAPVIPQQQQQPQPAGCSNRSCPGNECNDGTKYGADPCTPQATCELRDREACDKHGGPKGGGQTSTSAGGSCPGTSSNGCSGRNPGDIFHIAGTCLKCVKIGNTCGRDEVTCPADLSTVPAVSPSTEGGISLAKPVASGGGACDAIKSWPGCVGKQSGDFITTKEQESRGVCTQCSTAAGSNVCSRLWVQCLGSENQPSPDTCGAGSADGCYNQKVGSPPVVGGKPLAELKCVRSASSGPCSRIPTTAPNPEQKPTQSSPPAATQAVPIPTTVSGNKIDYCFKQNMVYVGGCVDKCLPQTKTAIEWTTAICGYTEQQQQEIANKLKGKDRDAELVALTKKKKEGEQAVSTQNTLDTYNTGPSAAKNCKNRGGTLINCDADGMLCVGDAEVNRTVECQKLHERKENAKGTGKNWLDNLITTGGDGQICKKDSDCVSNLCRGYQPGPGVRTCVSYSQAKSDYEASVKLTCTDPSRRDTCKIRGVDEPICLSSGQDKTKACDDLAKRIQAAEDKGMNSFDWQKALLEVGDKCSDAALCSTGICDVSPASIDKVCLTQQQYDLRNKKMKPAPPDTDLTGGYECVQDNQCRSGRCDKSNATWQTQDGVPIGKCDYVPPGNGGATKNLGDVCKDGTECRSGFCAARTPGSYNCVSFSDLKDPGGDCTDNSQCKSAYCGIDDRKCSGFSKKITDSFPIDSSRVVLVGAVCNISSGCLCMSPTGWAYNYPHKIGWGEKCYADSEAFRLRDTEGVSLGGACIKDDNCADNTVGVRCTDDQGVRVQGGTVGRCTQTPNSSFNGKKKWEMCTSGAECGTGICMKDKNASTFSCREYGDLGDEGTACSDVTQCKSGICKDSKCTVANAKTIDELIYPGWQCSKNAGCLCVTSNVPQGGYARLKKSENCVEIGEGASCNPNSTTKSPCPGNQKCVLKEGTTSTWQCKAPPVCGGDYASQKGCETIREKIPTAQAMMCDKYMVKSTECWRIVAVPPAAADPCKDSGWKCPGVQWCQKVNDTQFKCKLLFFDSTGPITIVKYGDKCTNSGTNSCSCSGHLIGNGDTCAPTDTECPSPRVIFQNKCIDPSRLPQPKVNGDCYQMQGAPACPEGYQCLKRAGAKLGSCVSDADQFTLGDECPTVGKECIGGGAEPSICKVDSQNQSRKICVKKTDEELCPENQGKYLDKSVCESKNSVVVTSKNAECAQGGNKCYVLHQIVLPPGATCLYEKCQCSTKILSMNPLTFDWITQNVECSKTISVPKQSQPVGPVIQPPIQKQLISKDKLCSYYSCPNWGTWCEPNEADQTVRCVWGIGGSGKGDTTKVIQEGQCPVNECICVPTGKKIAKDVLCE